MISLRITVKDDLPNYEQILNKFVVTAAHRIRGRMREKLLERKSGRLYARRGGRGFTRSHQASARGEAPASDSGKLSRSLKVVKRGSLEAAVETNVGYADILEGKMNRPLWGATADEMLPVLENDLVRMLN